jgi:hypothetical protein
MRWAVALVLLLTARPPDRLTAQARDSTHATVTIKPVAALWRSLLLPGWGQAATGRHFTGAAFATWEGVTIMMTVRAVQEQHYMEETGSKNLGSKRQQVQDWVVLWVFNHLFSGAEAFVSAHLQDFPKELKVRAFPGGIGVSLPLPGP